MRQLSVEAYYDEETIGRFKLGTVVKVKSSSEDMQIFGPGHVTGFTMGFGEVVIVVKFANLDEEFHIHPNNLIVLT